MNSTEEGFLQEIEQGTLGGVPFYCDWLLEAGREEEAEFWRFIQRVRKIPERSRPPFSRKRDPIKWDQAGGNPDYSFDWIGSRYIPSRESSLEKELYDQLPGFQEGQPNYGYREYPTRIEAYKALFHAWKTLREQGQDDGYS